MPFTKFYEIHPVLGARIEGAFFATADKYDGYNGGQWDIMANIPESNVYVVYPVSPETLNVGFDGNYIEPQPISNKAFGVYLSLMIYNHLCWSYYNDDNHAVSKVFSDLYHGVRTWLWESEELTEDEKVHIHKMIN